MDDKSTHYGKTLAQFMTSDGAIEVVAGALKMGEDSYRPVFEIRYPNENVELIFSETLHKTHKLAITHAENNLLIDLSEDKTSLVIGFKGE